MVVTSVTASQRKFGINDLAHDGQKVATVTTVLSVTASGAWYFGRMSTPLTVAVGPPPDEESAAVRPRRQARARAPEPPDEDVPFPPLRPGELLDMLESTGQVQEADLPPESRAELRRYRGKPEADPEPDATPIRERAARILSRRLGALEAILSDSRADAADVTRAMAEVRAIAGARTQQAKQARPLADVLQDMAAALRQHGWAVAEPANPGGRPKAGEGLLALGGGEAPPSP